MPAPYLLHHLIEYSAERTPDAEALKQRKTALSYAQLAQRQSAVASGLVAAGLKPSERVAIYMSKSMQWVVAAFGTSQAGGCFVPVNPVLKTPQVTYILQNCDVTVLVTSRERYARLRDSLAECSSLR
ncbi:MAG: AMP-binding protein, partial [Myxococcota bacterium]